MNKNTEQFSLVTPIEKDNNLMYKVFKNPASSADEKLTCGMQILQDKMHGRKPDVTSDILDRYVESRLITRDDARWMAEAINYYESEVGSAMAEKITLDMLESAMSKVAKEKLNITDYHFMLSEVYKEIDKIQTREDLDKTAVLFFDLDGLKSVNDNAAGKNTGHDAGDIYLKRIATVFTTGKTAKWLEKVGIRYIPVHRSGDEFLVSISAGFSVTESLEFSGVDGEKVNEPLVEYVIRKIKQDIQGEKFVDIFDFSEKQQREKFYPAIRNIRNSLGLENIEDELVLEEEIDKLLKDFEYRAGASAGWASLTDGFVKPGKNKKEEDVEKMSYEQFVVHVMGIMINTSDEKMKIRKDEEQKERREGSVQNKIQEALYRAGRSADEKRVAEETKKNIQPYINKPREAIQGIDPGLDEDKKILTDLENEKDRLVERVIDDGAVLSEQERKYFRDLQSKIQVIKQDIKRKEDHKKLILDSMRVPE